MTDEHTQLEWNHEDLLRRHRETSETLRRTMLALLTFSLFCWLTAVGSPDRSLIVSEPTVEVPFVDVALSFPAFLIVAPFLLIVFVVYLHVFYQERLKLEALLSDQRLRKALSGSFLDSDQAGRAAAIFNFDGMAARLLTLFVFYWLVPLTLGAITWKASARTEWRLSMIAVMVIVTAVLSLVASYRSRDRISPKWAGLIYAVLVGAIIGTVYFAPTWMVNRSLDLRRVDLERAWLLGADLAAADLRWADLSEANLTRANLEYANLELAELTGAELNGARLKGSNFEQATLISARFDRADLRDANLWMADLTGAKFSSGNVSRLPSFIDSRGMEYSGIIASDLKTLFRHGFEFADLQSADLSKSVLTRADLRNANLAQSDLTGAILFGADLSTAIGLTQEQLDSAIGDVSTKIPEGLTRPERWSQ